MGACPTLPRRGSRRKMWLPANRGFRSAGRPAEGPLLRGRRLDLQLVMYAAAARPRPRHDRRLEPLALVVDRAGEADDAVLDVRADARVLEVLAHLQVVRDLIPEVLVTRLDRFLLGLRHHLEL